MAGSSVITEYTVGTVKLVQFAWTSTAGGVVSAQAGTVGFYSGQILAVATVPGAGVSSYAITVIDSLTGLDMLLGAGTGRSTSATEYLAPSALGSIAMGTLSVAITGAGNVKTGTLYIWIR
jgi:hypothetical protein